MNISDIKLTRSELNLVRSAIELALKFHSVAYSSRDADEWLIKDFKQSIYALTVSADEYAKATGESEKYTLNAVGELQPPPNNQK